MTDRNASDNPPDVPIYNWETIPSFDYDGITVRGFRSSNVAIGYSQLRPGTPMKPPHTHDIEQIFMILEGRIKGAQAKPIAGYVPKPGVKYVSVRPPAASEAPEDKAGGDAQ